MSQRDDKLGIEWWNALKAELRYALKQINHLIYWPILLAIALFLFLVILREW